MPDTWETQHGLNPSVADNNGDFDSDGYTNLEEYLNEIAEWPAPQPIVFNGATNNRYAQITNWDIRWQPSKYDEAQINSGTAVVDAVGQHAGTIRIGAHAGDHGTLNITAGWLQVETATIIGGDNAATAALNLSGGELSTPLLSKGAGGSFNFTGGILHADTVAFDLVNDGGTISPGHSVGMTHVMGDLVLHSGSLAIELGSPSLADLLLVDGSASLNGALDVSTLGGFLPTKGDTWMILSTTGLSGLFSSITPGYSVQQQGNNLLLRFEGVPEPTTMLLATIAIGTIIARRRKFGDASARRIVPVKRRVSLSLRMSNGRFVFSQR